MENIMEIIMTTNWIELAERERATAKLTAARKAEEAANAEASRVRAEEMLKADPTLKGMEIVTDSDGNVSRRPSPWGF